MMIGYTKSLAKYIKERGRYYCSCQGCKYFDKSNTCINPNTTGYDIMQKDGRTFCIFWCPEDEEELNEINENSSNS